MIAETLRALARLCLAEVNDFPDPYEYQNGRSLELDPDERLTSLTG